jgi:hypothetical protein
MYISADDKRAITLFVLGVLCGLFISWGLS